MLFGTKKGSQSLRQTRKRWAGSCLALYLVTWGLLVFSLDRGYVGRVTDDGIYFVGAEAIANGLGYRLTSRPGNPEARKYPVGLPFVLAAAISVTPAHQTLRPAMRASRIVIALSACAFLWLSYILLLNFRMDPLYASVAVLAMSFHPEVLNGATLIMSDLLFGSLVLAVFLLVLAKPARSKHSPSVLVLCGAIAASGFYVRTNGVALFPALVATAILLPNKRQALLSLTAGILLILLPVSLMNANTNRKNPTDSANYRSELLAGWTPWQAGIAATIRNVGEFKDVLSPLIFPLFWSTPAAKLDQRMPLVFDGVQLGICAIFLTGSVSLIRRTWRRYLGLWLFGGLSLAIFMLWPWSFGDLGPRFLLCFLPLIILIFLFGIGRIAGLIHVSARKAQNTALIVVALAGLCTFASFLYRAARDRCFCSRSGEAALREEVNLVSRFVPQDAVVVSRHPELINIYTGRQAVPILEDDDFLAHRYGRWETIVWWMDRSPQRRYYLVAPPPDKDPQVRALLNDHRMRVDTIARAANCIVEQVEPNQPPGHVLK